MAVTKPDVLKGSAIVYALTGYKTGSMTLQEAKEYILTEIGGNNESN